MRAWATSVEKAIWWIAANFDDWRPIRDLKLRLSLRSPIIGFIVVKLILTTTLRAHVNT
jgi:hypothetical protein